MTLIEQHLTQYPNEYRRVWLADDASQITAGFDPDSAEGSVIYVIASKDVYFKNSKKQWQKAGTIEVIA